MLGRGFSSGSLVLILVGCTGSVTSSDLDGGPARDAASARDGGMASDAGQRPDGAPPLDDGGQPHDGGHTTTGPMVDRSDPMLHEHTLDPIEVDPAASDYISNQFAQLDTRAEPLGKLVVFLPGANNSPSDWRNHGRKLAEMGFHVVIPHYNNAWGSCSGSGCNVNTRWEALTGEDVSDTITASRADSAEGRVIAMLQHLTTAHPGGDWGYYLDGDTLRYSDTIIAGISHGATSSGLYGWRRPFWRVVMHSGGFGGEDNPPATSIDDYYGLSHTEDSQSPAHLSSWQSAGLVGEPTSIDGASPPYGGTHRLITTEPNSYPHCSVVVHSSSPMSDGAYVFEPAWRYMYGVDAL